MNVPDVLWSAGFSEVYGFGGKTIGQFFELVCDNMSLGWLLSGGLEPIWPLGTSVVGLPLFTFIVGTR